jgi:RNA polymerase sigma factor (sigma-70 family)
MLKRRTQAPPAAKPPRGEIDQAALELVARHGPQILATARRYATTPEDAEDAYQRAFEILLTKAPTTSERELIPWLKTVVKHEAFALRRQRERHSPVTDDGELADRGTAAAATHDQAERYEHLRQGAEALRQLKPQEVRALLLRAKGYSYAEICQLTGWTYTKVNRALTEGRQALAIKLAGIQGGIECAKLAPRLSALADGEASAEDLAILRPHMRTCLTCRATLKEFRAAPARVAVLAPPVGLAAGGGDRLRDIVESALAGIHEKLEGLLGATHQKAAALAERAHAASELAMGQKVAAVAASAAAIAGGGTAVDQLANHRGPPTRAHAQRHLKARAASDTTTMPGPSPSPAPPPETTPTAAPTPGPSAPTQPAQPPDPANEFTPSSPSPAASVASAGVSAPAEAQAPQPANPAPAARAGGSSEFAP